MLVGIGLLHPTHVSAWRAGRVPYLEELIQGAPAKIARAMQVFHHWAHQRGLQSIEVAHLGRGRAPQPELRFSESGDPYSERSYRTHYLPRTLPERQKQRLLEKLGAPPEIVVFWIHRDTRCSRCQTELAHGSLLLLEREEPLCLACAGLDHLVYVPRGDPALTRRARQHSMLSAVVVRFSRARKRYERQGILVEQAALHTAQEELGKEELR